MSDQPKVQQACPILTVTDLVAAVDYLVDKVGFTARFTHGEPPSYGIVSKDGHDVHVSTYGVDEGRAGKGGLYAYVENVDVLYADVVARGATVVQPLGDQPYGMRDFALVDLDGNLLAFGQEAAQS